MYVDSGSWSTLIFSSRNRGASGRDWFRRFGRVLSWTVLAVAVINSNVVTGHGEDSVRDGKYPIPAPRQLAPFYADVGGCTSAVFHPDGTRLVVASSYTGSSVTVWDWKANYPLYELPTECDPSCLAIAKDGSEIIAGTVSGCIYLWSTATGRLLQRFYPLEELSRQEHVGVRIDAVAMVPNCRRVLIVAHGRIMLWDVKRKQLLDELREGYGARSITVSDDRKWALAGTPSGALLVDVEKFRGVRRLSQHVEHDGAAISRNGKWVVTVDRRHTLRVWDTVQRTSRALGQPSAQVTHAAFNADSGHFVIAVTPPFGTSELQMWHAQQENVLWKVALDDGASFLVFHPQGNEVVCGLRNGCWRIFNTIDGRALSELSDDHPIFRREGILVHVCNNGRFLITERHDLWDRTRTWIRRWSLDECKPISDLEILGDANIASVNDDGTIIATWGWSRERNGELRGVYDMKAKPPRLIRDLKAPVPEGEQTKVVLSREGKYVAIIDGQAVTIWSVEEGREIPSVDERSETPYKTTFPCGNLVAVVTRDRKQVNLIHIVLRTNLLSIPLDKEVVALYLSDDGSRLLIRPQVVGSGPKYFRVLSFWHPEKDADRFEHLTAYLSYYYRYIYGSERDGPPSERQYPCELTEDKTYICGQYAGHGICMSRDGNWVAAAHYGETIKLWLLEKKHRMLVGEETHYDQVSQVYQHMVTPYTQVVGFTANNGGFVTWDFRNCVCWIWKTSTLEPVVGLVETANGGWCVITPTGHFDYDGNESTLQCIRHLELDGEGLVPQDETRRYYRPDVVARRVRSMLNIGL